jgi:acyl-CoA synthetase (NDP forming)
MDFELLEKYGIKHPESTVARSLKEAGKAADRIGYPVVIKIISPDVLHKTDVGGVLFNVRDHDEAVWGYQRLMKRLEGKRIDGVLVQRKASAGSVELIVGGKRDPQFGQLIMLGMGGIYVEVLRDFTFRVCPITRKDAREMIGELRGKPILDGARGRKPVDKEAVVDTLLKVSQLLVRENPKEFDINPLMVNDKECLAVDVRLLK